MLNAEAVRLVIRGAGFTTASAVQLSQVGYGYLVPLSDLVVISDSELEATVPRGAPMAWYNVQVRNSLGWNLTSLQKPLILEANPFSQLAPSQRTRASR